jgi:hypothetical protein
MLTWRSVRFQGPGSFLSRRVPRMRRGSTARVAPVYDFGFSVHLRAHIFESLSMILGLVFICVRICLNPNHYPPSEGSQPSCMVPPPPIFSFHAGLIAQRTKFR